MLTASEIKKIVPVLSVHTIANHVREGRTTRQAMLTYNREAARTAGARKGRATGEARGLYSPLRNLSK
jgi:hypothetical protein